MINFLKNYLSTISIIIFGYIFYTNNNYFYSFFNKDYGFITYKLNVIDAFFYISIFYSIFLLLYYFFIKEKSKARIIFSYLKNKISEKKYKINDLEKNAILGYLVKFFFAPLLVFWLISHSFSVVNHLYASYNSLVIIQNNFIEFFNQNLFLLCLNFILFIDVLFFSLGYLTESKIFKNTIKSVDKTLLGWFVVLICYPPFNGVTQNILGWYSSDFPQFTNGYIHIFLNISILILMLIYSIASVNLGLKASNLTNRGIVTKGVYSIVRHPAYICKNLAWWIGGIPVIISSIYNLNFLLLITAIISLIAWTYIYYLRAITEENHLNKDEDYKKYKKKVKYMFIPKII